MTKQKVRVFLLSNTDLTSNILFQRLFSASDMEIVGVAHSATLTKGKGGLPGAIEVLRKTDWRYWIYLVFTNGCFAMYERLLLWSGRLPGQSWLPSTRAVCSKRGIPTYVSGKFGDPAFLAVIANARPDLLVTRVDQMLTSEVLEAAPLGAWCVHSSLLPSYKGIAAEFHSIRNGESEIGTTVFQMTEQLDGGPLLFQQAVEIKSSESLFQHMIRNNRSGAELVELAVRSRANAELPELTPDYLPSYYSWPKTEQVREYRKRNHKLILFSEALRLLWESLRPIRP